MDKDDKDILKEAEELLFKFISIPSISGNEINFLFYLKEIFSEIGLDCILEDVDKERKNLFLKRGESSYLIATHADTVPPWNYKDAFLPKRENNKIFGRGAVDTKGQIVALFLAVKYSKDPVEAVIFSDEEKEGKGSEHFNPKKKYKGAIVLEPTDFSICIAQAGSIEVNLKIKGKEAHGALPICGENAIETLFSLYQDLKKLDHLKNSHPLFPPPYVNIGYIKGGIDCQIIPEECLAQIEISILPNMDFKKVSKDFFKILKKYNAHYKIINLDPPFEISKNEEVVKILSKSYKEIFKKDPIYKGMPAWTDADHLIKKKIPPVIFGAGKLEVAHTKEEYISLKDILLLYKVIKRFLKETKDE